MGRSPSWTMSGSAATACSAPPCPPRRSASAPQASLDELLAARRTWTSPPSRLSLSDRQACCIARALVRSPRVLILDESTSALDVATRDRLFAIVRGLCAAGAGVIFISHRMDEIDELADRVTVLRSGESVATLARGQATTEELVRHMTGRATTDRRRRAAPPPPRASAPSPPRARRACGCELDARRSTSSCAPGSSSASPDWRATGRTRFLQALAERRRSAGADRRRRRRGRCESPQQALRAGVVLRPARSPRASRLFPPLSIARELRAAHSVGRPPRRAASPGARRRARLGATSSSLASGSATRRSRSRR